MKGLEKVIICAVSFMSLCGCGTYSTVAKNNTEIKVDLKRKDTKCESISRVYSGVAYDFCVIHAEPRRPELYLEGSNRALLTFYGIDIILSSITDTIMLPITITQQNEYGTVNLQK